MNCPGALFKRRALICALNNFVSVRKGRVFIDVNWNSSGDSRR